MSTLLISLLWIRILGSGQFWQALIFDFDFWQASIHLLSFDEIERKFVCA